MTARRVRRLQTETAWFPPDATEPPLYVVAHMSVVNWKQIEVKHEGSYVAAVGAVRINPRLFPLAADFGGKSKPGSTVPIR